jgi:hypothetical protein
MMRSSRATAKQPQPVAKRKPIDDTINNSVTSNAFDSTAVLGGGLDGEEGGGGGDQLLERLRILLHRLQSTTEILQNWPEARGDSARVHADTCTESISAIRKIALGLRAVERHVNGTGPISAAAVAAAANRQTGCGVNDCVGGGKADISSSVVKEKPTLSSTEAFRTFLETSCPIPLDLLDMLDVGPQQNPFGLHPSCYARGLMEESLRQLARLERRRRALRMLADSIEKGMNEPLWVDCAVTVATLEKRKDDAAPSPGMLHPNKRHREVG